MTISERAPQMDDLAGPTGLLAGMAQPPAWVESLTRRIPRAISTTGRLPTGLWAVRLTLTDHGIFPMEVLLVPYPDQVRLTLWSRAWAISLPTPEDQWLALLAVARQLIGAAQQADPSFVVLVLPPTILPESAPE